MHREDAATVGQPAAIRGRNPTQQTAHAPLAHPSLSQQPTHYLSIRAMRRNRTSALRSPLDRQPDLSRATPPPTGQSHMEIRGTQPFSSYPRRRVSRREHRRSRPLDSRLRGNDDHWHAAQASNAIATPPPVPYRPSPPSHDDAAQSQQPIHHLSIRAMRRNRACARRSRPCRRWPATSRPGRGGRTRRSVARECARG
jgi:hypothetical protein